MVTSFVVGQGVERDTLIDWYRKNRARSKALFDLLHEDAYYSQPISLRHPIVFYEGHLPAFSFNRLVKAGLGGRSIDDRLERLFARGIDPEVDGPHGERSFAWPERQQVRAFADAADTAVLEALGNADLDRPGDPLLDRSEAVFAILEHEAMHQETLLYMWHRLPFAQKHAPGSYRARVDGGEPRREWVRVAAGTATLGLDRASMTFGWDNEQPSLVVPVESVDIERHDVTNGRFLEFVDSGGYADERWWTPEDWRWIREHRVSHPAFWERSEGGWSWRGMFELIPLPLSWPAYVSHAEASAFARWSGTRLPTEAEFVRAAYGSPEGEVRVFPWGDATPSANHGVFDFSSWDPEPAGSHPDGQSAWGVHDLVGNGWEWTATPFAPFPGFRPMASYPQYSADFFDGGHYVMKGASPATARELLRPTFRNWFRPHYPYVYATFRCARSAS